MSQAHVQVVLGDDTLPAPLEAALKRIKASTSFVPLSEALQRGLSPADAVVVVSPATATGGTQVAALLRSLGGTAHSALVLCGESSNTPGLLDGTLSASRDANPADLVARLEALLHARMMAKTRAAAAGSVQAPHVGGWRHDVYPPHLRIASRIRRRLLPPKLPRLPATRLRVVQRHREDASGDIYDVHRISAAAFGILLADAGRRGLPTPLLTVLMKRALHAGDDAGLDPNAAPAAILQRLNHELVRSGMCGGAPVAATYVVLDASSNRILIARGGSPYPIVRYADGRVELLQIEGPLLGLREGGVFSTALLELRPGDGLLLCSDGIDDLGSGGRDPSNTSRGAALLLGSLSESIDAALQHAANRHDVLRRVGQTVDDLTLFAIEAL